jgi:predicted amidophosphoribosyltransferase
MSEGERVCRNCGAPIGPHEKKCSNCGRLFIDSKSSRLGAEPPHLVTKDTPVKEPRDTGGGQAPVETPQTSGDGSGSSGPAPKPASYYAVAPMAYEECPYCGGPVNGGVCQKCGRRMPRQKSGCCACAIMLGIIGWLITLVFVL